MSSDCKEALMAALRYVSHKDRTIYEVRNKLKCMDYSEEVTDDVIEYLKEHSYLNDRRYAEYYLVCYKDKRSLRRIEMDLSDRGIEQELISEIVASAEVDEMEAVRNAVRKQMIRRGISDLKAMSFDERNKISSALYRQGYRVEHIREALADYNWK